MWNNVFPLWSQWIDVTNVVIIGFACIHALELQILRKLPFDNNKFKIWNRESIYFLIWFLFYGKIYTKDTLTEDSSTKNLYHIHPSPFIQYKNVR